MGRDIDDFTGHQHFNNGYSDESTPVCAAPKLPAARLLRP
jgi:hypothetical protein